MPWFLVAEAGLAILKGEALWPTHHINPRLPGELPGQALCLVGNRCAKMFIWGLRELLRGLEEVFLGIGSWLALCRAPALGTPHYWGRPALRWLEA